MNHHPSSHLTTATNNNHSDETAKSPSPPPSSPPSSSSPSSSLSPRSSFVVGLTCGLISSILFQPFDVLKSTFIIHPHCSSYRDIIMTITNKKWSGVKYLWRGLFPSMIRFSMGSGTYFMTQSYLMKNIIIQKNHNSPSPSHSSTSSRPSSDILLIGALSRAAAVILCCPISVIKTKIETNSIPKTLLSTSSSSFSSSPTPSMLSVSSFIYSHHGIRGFYSGLLPSLIKDSPYSAIYLLIYLRFKDLSKDKIFSRVESPIFHQSLSALLASSIASVIIHPAEVIKTNMQANTNYHINTADRAVHTNARISPPSSSSPSSLHSIKHFVSSVYDENGLRGFWRGASPRIVRRSLSNALNWAIYDHFHTIITGKEIK